MRMPRRPAGWLSPALVFDHARDNFTIRSITRTLRCRALEHFRPGAEIGTCVRDAFSLRDRPELGFASTGYRSSFCFGTKIKTLDRDLVDLDLVSHHHRKPDDTKQLDAQRSCVALGECRPRARSNKSTRRWCKGHEGVPHTWLWELDPERHRSGKPSRWVYQRVVCFGCGKVSHFKRRSFCGRCGSPGRYFNIHRETGKLEVPTTSARGYVCYSPNTTQYGPYCLCPGNFDERARTSRYWGELITTWADDPAQLLALREHVRLEAAQR